MARIDFAKHGKLLDKRDWLDSTYTSIGAARWAFFAIFVVLIIIVIVGTLRVNKKRTRLGMQPMYGTRWMTPPSYYQSQHQYDQPRQRDPDMPNTYVPTYTATANEYDMGFYDENGEFHANPNAKLSRPMNVDGPQPPEQTHNRQDSNISSAVPVSATVPPSHDAYEINDEHNDDDLYRPPPNPPYGLNRLGSSEDEFSPPLHAPPGFSSR